MVSEGTDHGVGVDPETVTSSDLVSQNSFHVCFNGVLNNHGTFLLEMGFEHPIQAGALKLGTPTRAPRVDSVETL